jgi:hypothetical protein
MGDNGASVEDPTGQGLTSEIGIMVNGEVDTEEFMLKTLVYSFDNANAHETDKSQYFEIIANRAFYKDGWMASTTPENLPWQDHPVPSEDPVKDYKWELYDLTKDFTQSNDIAAKNPEKLKEMQKAFMEEAEKYQIFPFDDRYIDRVNLENRPNLNKGRTEYIFHQGTSRITEGMVPNMKNTLSSITAEVGVKSSQEGMIITQGEYFAGLALMLQKEY